CHVGGVGSLLEIDLYVASWYLRTVSAMQENVEKHCPGPIDIPVCRKFTPSERRGQ
ncbi:hypothetical protein HAX54_049972, partial [Datura stramonium]|nr:hypothetical protein [Datura stramonium]